MNFKMNVNQITKTRFENQLKRFAEATGKTVEEGLEQTAEGVGKRLIHTVQPYGINAKVGDKFAMSIAKQVNRAIRHANVSGQDGSAAVVHKQNRNSEGQVPRDLNTAGQFKRSPVERGETDALIKRKMENAGIAKGAWFAATNQISSKKIGGVAKWITRHENSGYGSCSKSGKGLSYKITLTNSTPYIERVQSTGDVEKSISTGYKNFIKWLDRQIQKQIQKANA